MSPRHKLFASLFLFTLLLTGCLKAPEPQHVTLTEAQEKFLQICREELKYPVSILPVGRTVWIYVPLNEAIFDIQATPPTGLKPAPVDKNWSINFLEAAYKDKVFEVGYDIGLTKKYDKDLTYGNQYSQEYAQKQRDVLTAVTRAYFNVGSLPGETVIFGNAVKEETAVNPDRVPPQFFALVFADTKRGVAIKTISNFEDMRKALSNPPAISNDEYVKRYVYEVFGDKDLIGDVAGEHLKAEDISLPYFLAEQMENRIAQKFVRSAFPPTGTVEEEIFAIVAETLRLYEFKDFSGIKLKDMAKDKEFTYDKDKL